MATGEMWQQFVERNYQPIFGYCLRFLGNRADAEDATQDIFIKAFKHRSTFASLLNERSWIFSIARNCCIDRRRAFTRGLDFLKKIFVVRSGAATPTPNFELRDELQKLLVALPERQREVFLLRHFHGMSTRDTAEVLKIDEGTVKVHLKRAVDRMKQALQADDASTEVQRPLSLSTERGE